MPHLPAHPSHRRWPSNPAHCRRQPALPRLRRRGGRRRGFPGGPRPPSCRTWRGSFRSRRSALRPPRAPLRGAASPPAIPSRNAAVANRPARNAEAATTVTERRPGWASPSSRRGCGGTGRRPSRSPVRSRRRSRSRRPPAGERRTGTARGRADRPRRPSTDARRRGTPSVLTSPAKLTTAARIPSARARRRRSTAYSFPTPPRSSSIPARREEDGAVADRDRPGVDEREAAPSISSGVGPARLEVPDLPEDAHRRVEASAGMRRQVERGLDEQLRLRVDRDRCPPGVPVDLGDDARLAVAREFHLDPARLALDRAGRSASARSRPRSSTNSTTRRRPSGETASCRGRGPSTGSVAERSRA